MVFIQVVRGYPGGRLQLWEGGSKMTWLASAFSSILTRCLKKERRRDLTVNESAGWLVIWWTSAFLTKSCQQMARILHRHQMVQCINSPCWLPNIQTHKAFIGSMETLYRWSLVSVIIRDLYQCQSRFCIAERVMAQRLQISGSLLHNEQIITPTLPARQTIPPITHPAHHAQLGLLNFFLFYIITTNR